MVMIGGVSGAAAGATGGDDDDGGGDDGAPSLQPFFSLFCLCCLLLFRLTIHHLCVTKR